MIMPKHNFFGAAVILGLIVALWLSLPPSAIAALKAGSVPAAEMAVIGTIETVLPILRAEREQLDDNNKRIDEIVDAHIVPIFDMDTMSRWVLGKYWRKATPNQQKEFTILFLNMLRRTYGQQVLQFADSTVTLIGSKLADRKGYAIVDLMIEGGVLLNSKQVRYRMRQLVDGSWRIIDASVDGISVLVNFRSAMSDIIRAHGLDALLQRMREGQAFKVKQEL